MTMCLLKSTHASMIISFVEGRHPKHEKSKYFMLPKRRFWIGLLHDFQAKSIANLLQKKSIQPIATHRYNVLNACVCFFCSRLQAFYKRRAYNRSQRIAIMLSMRVCVSFVVDCKPFTKEDSRRQLTPKFGRIFGPRAWATL
jgi:hypothetical protein